MKQWPGIFLYRYQCVLWSENEIVKGEYVCVLDNPFLLSIDDMKAN